MAEAVTRCFRSFCKIHEYGYVDLNENIARVVIYHHMLRIIRRMIQLLTRRVRVRAPCENMVAVYGSISKLDRLYTCVRARRC